MGVNVAVVQSAFPEAGLRAEIRLLGQLLGETLREHEGQALYELEESIRAQTKALRQAYDPDREAELVAQLERVELIDAARLVRAFATYFQLVNLAELERQARAAAEGAGEDLEALVARCVRAEVPAERVASVLDRLEVRPVLTRTGSAKSSPICARRFRTGRPSWFDAGWPSTSRSSGIPTRCAPSGRGSWMRWATCSFTWNACFRTRSPTCSWS
jgi:hypothetical protein